jgi:hypothetical protein
MDHDTIETISRIAVLENEVKNLAEELRGFRREQKEQHRTMIDELEKLDVRLGALEKWRWMVVGGAVVCGYMLGQLPILK